MVEAVLTPRRDAHGVPDVSRRCGEVEADHVVEAVLTPRLCAHSVPHVLRRCGEVEAEHVVEATVRTLNPKP